jgi:hypothetical protein
MRIYNACGAYQWCTTTQEQASTCTFLRTTSTRVRTGSGRYTGTKTITSTSQQNAWDTCTAVDDITLNEFARKILEVEIVDDAAGGGTNGTSCSSPLAQPRILATNAVITGVSPIWGAIGSLALALLALLAV